MDQQKQLYLPRSKEKGMQGARLKEKEKEREARRREGRIVFSLPFLLR